MAKEKRISADDFLRLIEDENEHIKRDVDRSTFGYQPTINPAKNLDESHANSKNAVTDTTLNLGQSSDKPRSNLGQSSDKPRTNVSFIGLVGLQREIVLFLFETLKVSLSKVTPPIAISHLAESCKTTVLSAQKTLQRLGKARLVERVEFKNGRSGWTRYSLDERIYSEILQTESSDKLKTNLGQSSDKLKTQPRTEPRTSAPIVVVSSNLNNTTNTEAGDEPCFVIPNELSGKVSRRQLSEFVLSGKITESDLQLSLDAFAYDLKNKLVSTKYSSNPVALLIGAIKNNGSYNSAKYIEVLKSELKPFIQEQREVTAEKANQRTSKEWGEFQKFKTETPEDYKTLESKASSYGFTGSLLEEFTFLEFKKVILKTENEEPINPLRPPMSANP